MPRPLSVRLVFRLRIDILPGVADTRRESAKGFAKALSRGLPLPRLSATVHFARVEVSDETKQARSSNKGAFSL